MPEYFAVPAADGTAVPLSWFPAAAPHWSLLFLPAFGIQCRMYDTFARGLAAGGCSVLLMEQRGHGRSPLRASRSLNWGADEFLQQDIPAALNWLERQYGQPTLPVLLGGHSLGGHLSTLYSGQHPDHISGVLHVACGSPHYADFEAKRSRLIRFLCAVIPLFAMVPGYFPGTRLGFAGREARQLMSDWRDWALNGTFDYGQHHHLQDAVARFHGPVLSLAMEHDEMSTPAAEDRAVLPFVSARISRRRLGPAESGQAWGHFAWARNPAPVVEATLEWLQGAFSR